MLTSITILYYTCGLNTSVYKQKSTGVYEYRFPVPVEPEWSIMSSQKQAVL